MLAELYEQARFHVRQGAAPEAEWRAIDARLAEALEVEETLAGELEDARARIEELEDASSAGDELIEQLRELVNK